jgi:predicted TIM-barrel fold metal-dependent hydrolase
VLKTGILPRSVIACLGLTLALAVPCAAEAREPIIDMHVHALASDDQGPPPLAMCVPIDPMPTWDTGQPTMMNFITPFKAPSCKDPIWSPETTEEVMRRSLAVMERNNVIGVVSGRMKILSAWVEAAPGRVMPSLTPDLPIPADFAAELAQLKKDGRIAVLGELGFQYEGISPDDPRLEPLWAAAEANDIPVALHMGPGPPGIAYMPGMGYRARLSSPLLLEDVLVRHPKLRVNVMHAGFPMLDDTLALLYAHPQVYLDTGVIVYTQPRPAFYRYLGALIDAGFGKRIMFGSDQMVWPETMERGIAVIKEAPFLSEAQKRDILYNNAARFLKLDEATIARHHAM